MRLLPLAILLLVVGCTDRAGPSSSDEPAPTASATPAEPAGPAVLSRAAALPNGTVWLTPIAIVEGGELQEGGGASQDQQIAFLAAHFSAGHAHPLLVGGQRVGTAAVTSAGVSEMGYGFDVQGDVRLDAPMPVEWIGLAGLGGSPHALRRPVTPAERRIFLDIARIELMDLWVDFDSDMLPARLRAVALEGYGRPVLVGTVESDGPYGATDSFGDPATYTAFVIAEVGESGEYRAVFRRLGEGPGYGDGEGNASLLDVVDLDSDGAPEVVVEVGRYEGTDFEIYDRSGGEWRRLFTGGYVGL